MGNKYKCGFETMNGCCQGCRLEQSCTLIHNHSSEVIERIMNENKAYADKNCRLSDVIRQIEERASRAYRNGDDPEDNPELQMALDIIELTKGGK